MYIIYYVFVDLFYIFGSKIDLYKLTNNIKQDPLKIMRPQPIRIIDGACSFVEGNSMVELDFVLMSWILSFLCSKCWWNLNILLICPNSRVRHTEPCSEKSCDE